MSVMVLLQNYTTTSEQDYFLIKSVLEASMYEAVDYGYYREHNDVRIIEEKFVENFIRRFAESADLANTYVIEIYDISTKPPKVSLKVSSTSETTATGEIMEFDVVNNIDAILETKYWEENKKMNNFMIGLKRFFTNKNVVTIILVIIISNVFNLDNLSFLDNLFKVIN